MKSEDLEGTAPDTVVFRLVRVNKLDFIPPGIEKPLPRDFELSSDDKKDPVPLLTVWDHGKSSISQVNAIRKDDEGSTKAFALHAADVENKVFFPDGSNSLRVVRDPLDLSVPGADGHCGISGLHKRRDEQRQWYKHLRMQLVDLCWPLNDSHSVP